MGSLVRPISMCMSSSHMLPAINPAQTPSYTRRTKRQRDELTIKESLKSSMDLSHPWYYPLPEEWAETQQQSIYRRIAAMIADKKKQNYGQTLMWLRCRFNFAVLRTSIMCLRGTRARKPTYIDDSPSPAVVMRESELDPCT